MDGVILLNVHIFLCIFLQYNLSNFQHLNKENKEKNETGIEQNVNNKCTYKTKCKYETKCK